jgi:hypothetical protein
MLCPCFQHIKELERPELSLPAAANKIWWSLLNKNTVESLNLWVVKFMGNQNSAGSWGLYFVSKLNAIGVIHVLNLYRFMKDIKAYLQGCKLVGII